MVSARLAPSISDLTTVEKDASKTDAMILNSLPKTAPALTAQSALDPAAKELNASRTTAMRDRYSSMTVDAKLAHVTSDQRQVPSSVVKPAR